jgi:hypothetical protein
MNKFLCSNSIHSGIGKIDFNIVQPVISQGQDVLSANSRSTHKI